MKREGERVIRENVLASIIVASYYRRTAIPPYRLKPSSK